MTPDTTAYQGLSLEQWRDIAQTNEQIDRMNKEQLAVLTKELYKHLTLTAAAYERQREFFLPYYREAVIGDMTSWSD
jgi:hypothetical protein